MRLEALLCSATIQKTRAFSAHGARDKCCRHELMNWHTNSMPFTQKLDQTENKSFIRYLNSADSAEKSQSFYIGFSLSLID